MLINNAGVVQGKTLLDLSPVDVQQYVAKYRDASLHS